MQTGRPLHRGVIGQTRGLRGPDSIEMAFAGLIMAIVVVLATGFAGNLTTMVRTLEAVMLASGVEHGAIVYRAVHGAWPPPDQAAMITEGIATTDIEGMRLGPHGTVTAELRMEPLEGAQGTSPFSAAETVHGFLSFRPVMLGSQVAPTVVYLCGYADPVVISGVKPAVNNTTLDPGILPPFCR